MPDAPAGPPTPPVALSALLALEDLGLRRIAGPADAELLWVHTSEMADPYPYLLGGELLLTAGVLLTDPDAYAARLVEAGAAALGFGVRPVHEAVPPELVAACERHGLPLVEVGPGTPFTAIARAVWRLMAEARLRELRRVARAQQALATAAARPDPVPAVLHQLAAQLPGYAVLRAVGGEELHTAGRLPAPSVRAALSRLADVVAPADRGAPATATDTAGGARLSAYGLGGGHGLVLAVATGGREMAGREAGGREAGSRETGNREAGGREAGDHTLAGVAVVLLSLLAAPHQSADAAHRSAALVRLLLGAEPAAVAPLLGGDGSWAVVHALRGGGRPADPLAAGALGAALGSALVDAGAGTVAADGVVRVLVPGGGTVSPQPGWTLGVSAPATAGALAEADAQAARALGRARATRTPLVRQGAETGRGLASLVDAGAADAHARALLAPLTPVLAETLRCWLSLHGGWDRTATALGVHRNTVRQRVARCAALLDADLDDMDVRTELWFALGREAARGSL
ncbi:PucR family transcriptional regulator [Streptomyces sp. NPDC057682]|uniref:PucR family transcriptional regulator n=1 Tax=Streptomyces sp. NPDC057682 TaxID=3346210 RepID=UPI0036A636E6